MSGTKYVVLSSVGVVMVLLLAVPARANVVSDNFNTGVDCDINENRGAPRQSYAYGNPTYTKVGNWGWIPSLGMTANIVSDQLVIGATTDQSNLLGVWMDPTFASAVTGQKYEAAADFIFAGTDVNNPRSSQLAVSLTQASSAYTSNGVTASLTNSGAWQLYVNGSAVSSGTVTLPTTTNHVVLAFDETGASTAVTLRINGTSVGSGTESAWGGSARYLGVGASVGYLNTARNAYFDNLSLDTIPEPSSATILVWAIGGLLAYAWRRRK